MQIDIIYVRGLQAAWPAMEIDLLDMGLRTHEILENALEFQLTVMPSSVAPRIASSDELTIVASNSERACACFRSVMSW